MNGQSKTYRDRLIPVVYGVSYPQCASGPAGVLLLWCKLPENSKDWGRVSFAGSGAGSCTIAAARVDICDEESRQWMAAPPIAAATRKQTINPEKNKQLTLW